MEIQSPHHQHHIDPCNHFCRKVFLASVVFVGTTLLVVSTLSLLAGHGMLPNIVNDLSYFTMLSVTLGDVNNYLLAITGFVLFTLGIAGWANHFRYKT